MDWLHGASPIVVIVVSFVAGVAVGVIVAGGLMCVLDGGRIEYLTMKLTMFARASNWKIKTVDGKVSYVWDVNINPTHMAREALEFRDNFR